MYIPKVRNCVLYECHIYNAAESIE